MKKDILLKVFTAWILSCSLYFPLSAAETKFRITLINGKKDTVIGQTSIDADAAQKTGKLGIKDSPGLKADYDFLTHKGYSSCEVSLENSGVEEQWIEVRISVPYSLPGKISYWDGFMEYKRLDAIHKRDKLDALFPLCAVYTDNGKGVALGIEPHQIRSYLKAEADPEKKLLSYSTRMVLEPGKKDSMKFIFFNFKNNFGWRDAVQCYYDFFPEIFRPAPGIDPRIFKPAAGYLFWVGCSKVDISSGKKNAFEFIRKLNTGSDWCYGASAGLRQGDLWPSEYTLNWQEVRPLPGKKKARIWNKEQIEKAMDFRKKCLTREKEYNTAAMAYTVPTFCEETLAKEHFSECILDPKDSKIKIRFAPWVYASQDSLKMYPCGNAFGKKVIRDILKYIKEWPFISGFSFDCGVPGIPHYGKGVERSPGKAYMPGKGVYAMQATGLVKLAEKIHSQKNKYGYNMGILVNLDGGECYYSWLVADASIYESSPQVHLYGYDPIHFKLWMGEKPTTWWWHYILPQHASMSKKNLYEAVSAMVDYMIIYSFYMGAYPGSRMARGVPEIQYYMPFLIEMVRLGWKPAPAFTADERLWCSRYGKGLGCCIVMGNPTLEQIRTDINVINSYLGKGNFIFADCEGKQTSCRIKDGRTELCQTIKSGAPLLLRAVASLDSSLLPSGMISSKITTAEGEFTNLKIDIPCKKDSRGIMRLWKPERHYTADLRLNAKNHDYKDKKKYIELNVTLKKGKNTINLKTLPEISVDKADPVLEFPFIKNGAPNFKIVIGKNPSEMENIYAEWIRNFFSFYYKYSEKKPLSSEIKIISAPDSHDENYLIMGTPQTNYLIKDNVFGKKQKGRIYVEGKKLYVSGKDIDALRESVLLLLRTLDKKYIFYGYFNGLGGAGGMRKYIWEPGPGSKKLGITESGGFFPWVK